MRRLNLVQQATDLLDFRRYKKTGRNEKGKGNNFTFVKNTSKGLKLSNWISLTEDLKQLVFVRLGKSW